MTAVLDEHQIEQVIKAPSDAAGSFRDVWFFGDIVIKRDKGEPRGGIAGCISEYQRSKELSDTTFEFNNETWSLRFPKTSMIGDYLIMERIYGESASAEACDECEPFHHEDGSWSYWDHSQDGCFLSELDHVVSNICCDLGIYDMHDLNWRLDRELRTVWVVDFAG